MGYAFISYSASQPRQLHRVKEYLKANEIDFWAAPDDIPIGSKYSEVITRAISDASCVLFLLSDRSQNSTYCKLEVALALKQEKPIIPIQLEDVILNDEFSQYLNGSGDFFPLPRKFTTAKSNRLLNQLRLLCGDPEEGPVEPVDPSYKLGWFKKGTWLQLFGWLWMLCGIYPFIRLGNIVFPIPPTYDTFTGDGLDRYNAPVIAQQTFQSGLLVCALLLLGLLCVCYGFSLNRKLQGKERLYFGQFSLCQLLLLATSLCVCFSSPIAFQNTVNHLDNHVPYLWVDLCTYLDQFAMLMYLGTLVFWLIKQLRRALRNRKTKQPA